MSDAVDELISSYDFDAAETAIGELPDAEKPHWEARLRKAKLACEPAARRRSTAIQAAARSHDFDTLLAIAKDPLTERLLKTLPDELSQAAFIQLESAETWRERKVASMSRRLSEAQDALDNFDLPLARSLTANIDDRYLTDSEMKTRDGLLIAIEARTMETEALAERAAQAEAELKPPKPNRKRWFRRKSE